MSIFKTKKQDIPTIPLDKYEPVLRCSICSGEQVLCRRDLETGHLQELMLIRSPSDLYDFCEVNHIDPDSVRKVY